MNDPKPGKWWYFPLRPICWAQTRIAWPYPIEGHGYIFIREWAEPGKELEEYRCETCGKRSIVWSRV